LTEAYLDLDYAKILKQALSGGGEYADIYVEKTAPTALMLEDGKVEKVVTGHESGAGIRVIQDLKTIYAYTNDLSESGLIELAGSVAAACGKSPADMTIDLIKKTSPVDFPIKISPGDVEIERKLALVKEADRVARGLDDRVKQVTVIYRDTAQEIMVAASDGTLATDTRYYTLLAINALARKGDVVQTGYETMGGNIGFEIFSQTTPEELAIKAAGRAVMMLGARKAPGGRMPVVLSSEAGGTMVHEAVGHGLEADLAQNGLSVYTGKIGEQIASPLITVLDDATIPNKRGSFRFDDEGTVAQKTVLVDKGVLKGYMYDRLTAMKDGTVSTGNGRRDSYQSRPIVRMTNTMIAPGDTDPAEIVKSCEKGLFIRKMGGGQVNTVSGDFVFEINDANIIQNGEIGEPVRGATLVGNGPEVLKGISMVGNDLGYGIGTCGKDGQGAPVADAQPTLMIPDIVVGGTHE